MDVILLNRLACVSFFKLGATKYTIVGCYITDCVTKVKQIINNKLSILNNKYLLFSPCFCTERFIP